MFQKLIAVKYISSLLLSRQIIEWIGTFFRNESISEQWYVFATIEGQAKRELLDTSTFTATFIDPNVNFDKSELTFRLDLGCNTEMLQRTGGYNHLFIQFFKSRKEPDWFQFIDELQIINTSGRNLNAHFKIDSPFVIMNRCNCCTDALDATLISDEPMLVRVYFPFDVDKSETSPQKYTGYLRIEYDEHKNIVSHW